MSTETKKIAELILKEAKGTKVLNNKERIELYKLLERLEMDTQASRKKIIDNLTASVNSHYVLTQGEIGYRNSSTFTDGDGIDSAINTSERTITVGVDVTDLIGNGLVEEDTNNIALYYGILLYDISAGKIYSYPFTASGFVAAIAALGSGDEIRLPAGTLTLTAGFTLPENTTLNGAGVYATFITANGTYGTLITLESTSCIEDMTINYTSTTATNLMLIPSNNSNQIVRRIHANFYPTTSSEASCFLTSISSSFLLLEDSRFVCDGNGGNRLGINIGTATTTAYIRNCYGYGHANTASVNCKGIYISISAGGPVIMTNCYGYGYGQWFSAIGYGIYTFGAVRSYVCNGLGKGGGGIGIGFECGTGAEAYSCYGEGAGDGGGETIGCIINGGTMRGCYGLSQTNNRYGLKSYGTSYAYNCQFQGSTYDIWIVNGTLTVYAVQYDTLDNDGTLVRAAGDILGFLGTGTDNRVTQWNGTTGLLEDSCIVGPTTNVLTIINAATSTLAINVAASKVLTLTSADTYNFTIPGTGTAVITTRTITSGAGLSGGGDLSADRTLAVGAGTLITVGVDDVGITPAASQYKFIISGITPFAAAWSDFSLRGTTGGTTNFAVTDTKTLTLTSVDSYNLTVPATGTAALMAYNNVGNFTATGLVYTNTTGVLDIAAGVTANIDAALTITTALTNNTGAGILTWPAGGATLTIPATGTAALLATANVFTAIQKINVNNALALLVEQDGVKDNVFIVDTTNGRVGINIAPSYAFDQYCAAASTGVTYGARFITASTGTGTPITLLFQSQQINNIAASMRGIYGSAYVESSTAAAGATNVFANYAGVAYTLSGAFNLDITGKSAAFYAAIPTIVKTGGGTMTVAAHSGIWIENQGFSGCVTSYGVYIAAQSGSSTNYAIYTNAGNITFNAGLADAADFLLNGTTYALIQTDANVDELYLCNNAAAKLSFFAATPIVRPTALTAQLTTLTYTAPGTPDYAIQDFVNVALGAGWAFANHDEANSVLKAIENLQVRLGELEDKLGSTAGLGLITH